MDLKKCSYCKDELPLTEFKSLKLNKCLDCNKIAVMLYRNGLKGDTKTIKEYVRQYRALKALSPIPSCSLCGKNEKEIGGKLSLDHDHKTNKLRGLICGPCNRVLGFAYDNIDTLKRAIIYLTEHGKN